MIDPATLIYQAGVTTIDRALPKGRAAEYLIPYHGKGEANGRAVLTVQQVRRIRARQPLSRPAYAKLLETLEQRVNKSVEVANLTDNGEPPLTPFPPAGDDT